MNENWLDNVGREVRNRRSDPGTQADYVLAGDKDAPDTAYPIAPTVMK